MMVSFSSPVEFSVANLLCSVYVLNLHELGGFYFFNRAICLQCVIHSFQNRIS